MGFAVLGGLSSPSRLSRLAIDVKPDLAPYPKLGKASKECLAGKAENALPDGASEFWTCPICCADLGSNREEIGALVFQGKRIEQALYHLGCVSMMLIHGLQQGQGRLAGPKHRPKISGQSPVTRKAVDGFLPIPALTQGKEWAQFMDWKGVGKVNAEEAYELSASLLPSSQKHAVEDFIRKKFGVQEKNIRDHEITIVELQEQLLPFIEEQACTAAKLQKSNEPELLFTKYHCNFGPAWDTANKRISSINAEAFRCITGLSVNARFLAREFGPSMWRVCRFWHMVARRLFVREACVHLENGVEVGGMVAVLKALAFIAKSTDTRAQKLSLALLRDFRLDVRQHGLGLLASASSRGDVKVIEKVHTCLSDVATPVREAALIALGRTAQHDCEKTLRKVASYLSDKEPSIRKAAEQTLEILSSKGNECTISEIIRHFSSNDPAITRSALKFLVQFAPRGHIGALVATKEMLKNKDATVRRVAVSSFSQIVDHNDKKSLQAIVTTLKDSDVEVREASIKSLVFVMHPQFMSPLLACLKDSQASVRVVCLQALQGVATRGDMQIVKVVTELLKDDDALVRTAAAELLGDIASQRDPKVVQMITTLLHGDHAGREVASQVRSALELALRKIDPAQADENASPIAGISEDPDATTRSSKCFCLACLPVRRR